METKRKLYIAAAVLIVLVVALGLLTACTSESLVAYEAPAVGTAPTSYTLTVQATKGETVTSRALSLDSGVLNASWTKDDVVMVYDADGAELGSLTAASSGVETMLEGTLTTLPANGDVLTLKFLSPDYATQDGTLDYIAAHCDYATASVTVLSIDGTDVTTTGAVFENQQSIVKFTLQDFTSAAISATDMTIVADGNTYSIKTTSATSEFFVALPSISNKTIQVTAANETNIYTFVREGITIESGKYYTLTTQMTLGNLKDLSTLNGNYEAKDGDILTGTLNGNYQISIAAGASITLNNVSINASGIHSGNTDWAGITCLGDATITLVGDNVVNACADNKPGIQAGGEDTTLTIKGTGSLTAMGGVYAAGIGSGNYSTSGNISISGGEIIAKGGVYAAGIGSGYKASCGVITITGGSIKATGGDGAAGIGSGYDGSCGDISISGGTISATGGEEAAGIGSGRGGVYGSSVYGTCGDISISGGAITATGGDYAAGIGSGYKASCGVITISGTASGSAKGGDDSPYDIGPGVDGTCGNVSVEDNTISGGHLVDLSTLNGNYVAMNGAVLTGTIDNTKKITIAAGASITLNNVSINARGTLSGNTWWAGLTCLGNATITLVGTNVVKGCNDGLCGIQAGPANTTLTINGTGSLSATGAENAAGIGSGRGGECGNISIIGGNIAATGGFDAAGIGSGAHGSCGNISISGGTINATGVYDGAGIGSGWYGSCGSISISGTASGSAKGGKDSPYDIGSGKDGTCGTVSVQGNTISGTCPVAACTFTLNFYENYNENGGMNQSARYNANASTIKVTIGSEEYTATGTYHHSSNVSINLPVGTGMTLTITAPDTEYWYEGDGHQTGDFSATLTNVTLYNGLTNDLGEVNLVKQ